MRRWDCVGYVLCLCWNAQWTIASVENRADACRVIWEEEIPNYEFVKVPKERSRTWFSLGKLSRPEPPRNAPRKEPHPLRTDEWKLNVCWKRRRGRENHETLYLDFALNGFLRVRRDDETVNPWIGTWKLTPTGLTWNVDLDDHGSPYSFHADLHINPFGSHPRCNRGVVVLENRRWFRPVVATFSGIGVGEDAVDLSYRDRHAKKQLISQ